MPDEIDAEYITFDYQFVPIAKEVNSEDPKDINNSIKDITK